MIKNNSFSERSSSVQDDDDEMIQTMDGFCLYVARDAKGFEVQIEMPLRAGAEGSKLHGAKWRRYWRNHRMRYSCHDITENQAKLSIRFLG